MNGPHSVTAPGPCLQNNSVFAPRRYHENIGQGEMRWRVLLLLLYSWRPVARDLTSVKVCMLPAYNYPLPGLSLFVCRLNTIMETLNRVWQTPWYKQDRVTGKTVSSRHYQREEGETEYLSLTVQCLSHTGVGKGEEDGKICSYLHRGSLGGNLRKAFKQTLGETSRNNFSPLSILSMQDDRVYNFLNSSSKVKYFRNNLCSLFPHISRQMSKSAGWAPGLTGLGSPRFSEFVSPVERGKN